MQYTTTLIISKEDHEKICSTYIPFENKVSNPDVLIISEEKSIGIQNIKDITPLLFRMPFQEDYKLLFVLHAESMTREAQNAFLKVLEEPPENTQIILFAQNSESLLPTVLSRCVVVHAESNKKEKTKKASSLPTMEDIKKTSMGERVELLEKYTVKKEQAVSWCQELLIQAKNDMELHPTSETAIENAQRIQDCLVRLGKNVNAKLAVGSMLFQIEPNSLHH